MTLIILFFLRLRTYYTDSDYIVEFNLKMSNLARNLYLNVSISFLYEHCRHHKPIDSACYNRFYCMNLELQS